MQHREVNWTPEKVKRLAELRRMEDAREFDATDRLFREMVALMAERDVHNHRESQKKPKKKKKKPT